MTDCLFCSIAAGAIPADVVFETDDVVAAARNKGQIKFTAVGYGKQLVLPVYEEAERIRMRADPKLIKLLDDFDAMILSNNANTGGTCFGDSGGPNFYYDTLTVAGVTSFGTGPYCQVHGGVRRIDTQEDLEFICDFVDCALLI